MRTVVAGAVALALLAGCTASNETPPAPCGSPVRTDALPEWARAGFSGDGAGVPHVLGANGDLLAVVFGSPLSSPPSPGRNNKILWVSRQPVDGDPLVITAKLDGTGDQAEQQIAGGPGPSIVDLPRPGCWRLDLTWSGFTDSMDLVYQAG
ncbi:hypothetical protein [Paractinoplanes maris]|uniref:hypothetical protein n=1 Tax=Paractinoplanes maris TaxID=1734446 RepID=UPI0020221709|nr:hypothetical protein [Actinoplanes maris]